MIFNARIWTFICLALSVGPSCLMNTCGDEPWSGVYSGSSTRQVTNCTEPVGEAPSADEVEVTSSDDSGRFEVYIHATGSPNCTLHMRACDFNVAVPDSAEQCEGGVAPEGFSLSGLGSTMGRLQGKLKIDLFWENDANPDCIVEDYWTLR